MPRRPASPKPTTSTCASNASWRYGWGAICRGRARPTRATACAPRFELIEDRFADYKSSKALSLIADNAWNGGVVIGPPQPLPAGLDLDGIAGALESSGRPAAAGRTDDPLGALAWLANQAVECGRPMTAGMVVITGSVMPTVDIAPGERLDFTLDGIGATSLTAA